MPPAAMPLWHRGRPRKRWTYMLFASRELVACAAVAEIAGLPRRWWAIATPDGALVGRAAPFLRRFSVAPERVYVRCGATEFTLEASPGGEVEVISPTGRSFAWTRKRYGPARARLRRNRTTQNFEGGALLDESAGYHPRRTRWRWCAGVGTASSGETIAWNLVRGIHDSPQASERTVWVAGEPYEVPAVEFEDDLTAVHCPDESTTLHFRPWSKRSERLRLGLIAIDYRQPFGAFSGELPGGLRLVTGTGVMEFHDARW